MNNLNKPVPDDDDDRLLFEKLEANAITHYPNPSRCGCPPRETLRRFVDTPRDVTVEELNDLHIFQCAECTLELRRLREAREAQRRRNAAPRGRWWVAASLVLILGASFLVIRLITNRPEHISPGHGLDLALPQETGPSKTAVATVVYREHAALNIQLPSDARDGIYEVVLSKQPGINNALFRTQVNSSRVGQALRLTENLDLRSLPAGEYWMGIESGANQKDWFLPVTLR